MLTGGVGPLRDAWRAGMCAVAGTRPGSVALRTALPVLDHAVRRATGGRRTMTGSALPTLLLTTTGRVTGQPRSQFLIYVPDGEDMVVVGTNWGQPHHPAWTANLLANPEAIARVSDWEIPVTAVPLEGAEHETWFRRFVAMAPNYGAYRAWSGDRVPRMFRLRPRG